MYLRLLILGLLLAFSFCYTEWGNGQSAFIFQMEWDFFSSLRKNFSAFGHPLILAGLLGQIGLISVLFVKKPRPLLVYLCTGFLTCIVIVFTLAGIFSSSLSIMLSTVPFYLIAFLLIQKVRKA